ncbi:hypothetical protein PR048_024546 [Dryococelus australis]|uniref:Uncharacterized protein n=1 Tax=Dryococelus australis TaxID=614101 RepID=A0ABQ9GNY8_9NEOP|nr:hypothetical protein PR048_024546 [Dryococelus australis]
MVRTHLWRVALSKAKHPHYCSNTALCKTCPWLHTTNPLPLNQPRVCFILAGPLPCPPAGEESSVASGIERRYIDACIDETCSNSFDIENNCIDTSGIEESYSDVCCSEIYSDAFDCHFSLTPSLVLDTHTAEHQLSRLHRAGRWLAGLRAMTKGSAAVTLRYTLLHGLTWGPAHAGCCPEADATAIVTGQRLPDAGYRGAVPAGVAGGPWRCLDTTEAVLGGPVLCDSGRYPDEISHRESRPERGAGVSVGSHPYAAGPSMLRRSRYREQPLSWRSAGPSHPGGTIFSRHDEAALVQSAAVIFALAWPHCKRGRHCCRANILLREAPARAHRSHQTNIGQCRGPERPLHDCRTIHRSSRPVVDLVRPEPVLRVYPSDAMGQTIHVIGCAAIRQPCGFQPDRESTLEGRQLRKTTSLATSRHCSPLFTLASYRPVFLALLRLRPHAGVYDRWSVLAAPLSGVQSNANPLTWNHSCIDILQAIVTMFVIVAAVLLSLIAESSVHGDPFSNIRQGSSYEHPEQNYKTKAASYKFPFNLFKTRGSRYDSPESDSGSSFRGHEHLEHRRYPGHSRENPGQSHGYSERKELPGHSRGSPGLSHEYPGYKEYSGQPDNSRGIGYRRSRRLSPSTILYKITYALMEIFKEAYQFFDIFDKQLNATLKCLSGPGRHSVVRVGDEGAVNPGKSVLRTSAEEAHGSTDDSVGVTAEEVVGTVASAERVFGFSQNAPMPMKMNCEYEGMPLTSAIMEPRSAQSLTGRRRCRFCDRVFTHGQNARRYSRTVCTKSPFHAMKHYDIGLMQSVQGDTLKEHTKICIGKHGGGLPYCCIVQCQRLSGATTNGVAWCKVQRYSPPTKARRVRSPTVSHGLLHMGRKLLLVGEFSRRCPVYSRTCIPPLLHTHLALVNATPVDDVGTLHNSIVAGCETIRNFPGLINASGCPCNDGLMHVFVLIEGILNISFSADDRPSRIPTSVQSMSCQSQCSRVLQAPSRTVGFTCRFHALSDIHATNTSAAIVPHSPVVVHTSHRSRTLARRPPPAAGLRHQSHHRTSLCRRQILRNLQQGRGAVKQARRRSARQPDGRCPLFTGFRDRMVRGQQACQPGGGEGLGGLTAAPGNSALTVTSSHEPVQAGEWGVISIGNQGLLGVLDYPKRTVALAWIALMDVGGGEG